MIVVDRIMRSCKSGNNSKEDQVFAQQFNDAYLLVLWGTLDEIVHHRRKHLRRNGNSNGVGGLGYIRTCRRCIFLVQSGLVRPLPHDGIKHIEYTKLVSVGRGVEAIADRLEDLRALLHRPEVSGIRISRI